MGRLARYKWIGTIGGAVLLVFLLRVFAFTSCFIPSKGMENSILEGERILVNRWSYGLRVPLMSLWGYHRWGECLVSRNDVVVFNNPAGRQPMIDGRDVFIGRCVGVPGDTLWTDSLFAMAPSGLQPASNQTSLYAYPASKEELLTSLLAKLRIKSVEIVQQDDSIHVRSFSRFDSCLLEQALRAGHSEWLRAQDAVGSRRWNPVVVPGKGRVLRVYPWNITLLCNTLVLHEGRQAEVRNDTLYVDGKPTQHCAFTKDYYWMVSNNPINLADSRLFGFVPQDHVIGKAAAVWFSKEQGTGWLEGYRWNRFFRRIE